MSIINRELERSIERTQLNPLQRAMLDATVPLLTTKLKLENKLIPDLVYSLAYQIGTEDIQMPTVNFLNEEENNQRSQIIFQIMPDMMASAVTEMLKTYPVPDVPLNRRTLNAFLRENSFSVSQFILNPDYEPGSVPLPEPGDENENKSFFFMMNIVVHDMLAIDSSQSFNVQTLNHFLRTHRSLKLAPDLSTKDSFFNKHKSVINGVFAVGAGIGLTGGTYCALVLAGVITGATALTPPLALGGLTIAAMLILAGVAALVKYFCDQNEVPPPGFAMSH